MWAKVNGNYENLPAGWIEEAVAFLTGAPSLTYDNSDSWSVNNNGTKAWDIIDGYYKSGYIINCATPGNSDSDLDPVYGLPESHSYTILGAYSIKNSKGVITNRLF